MLYLEDYVEMIEHLPQELRDRFTEMREMDLGVQNNMDTLEKRVRLLFGSCRRNEITTDQANTEFNDIRKGYNRTLEEADEKVNLANQMYELVERYLRRLDTEIYKIKCELEADNKGITEVLEKRSLELDMPVPVNPVSSGSYKDSRYRQKAEKRRDSWAGVGAPLTIGGRASAEGRTLLAATAPLALSRTESAIQAALSRGLSEAQAGISSGSSAIGLGHLAAGTAIAAAASQAIVATQHMQQGRRTASLKASYEAISAAAAAAANSAGLNISSTSMGGSSPALGGTLLHTSTQREPHHTITHHTAAGHHSSNHHSSGHHSSSHHGGSSASANKRHKKKTTSSSYSTTVGNISNLAQNLSGTPTASRSSSPSLGASSSSAAVASASLPAMNVEEQLTDGEWSFDPNEPRYCICNQVSYGDMVACDNEDCPFEWFHYPCVGVTAPPKGKWYCPQCNVNVRRNRGNRKN